MNDLRTAAQQALEVLDAGVKISPGSVLHDRFRAALAEPEQSPEDVGYVPLSADGRRVFIDGVGEVPLDFGALAEPEPEPESVAEPFVVRHYIGDERPIIKGNGFDGLEVGLYRDEAEQFVSWINARIATPPARRPLTDHQRGDLVLEHLGPAALTGGKMSVYDAFLTGLSAAERAHGITGGNDE